MQASPYESAAVAQLCAIADEADRRERQIEEAVYVNTLQARRGISAIKCMSERDVCAVLDCLKTAMDRTGWIHTDEAQAAMEALTDACVLLERQAEREQ